MSTQHEQLLKLFSDHGNVLTLGQIMQTTLAAEYRARMTELRRKGYSIGLQRGKTPSQNTYTLTPPFKVEANGQMNFLGSAA